MILVVIALIRTVYVETVSKPSAPGKASKPV
jgi:hypothetical protein